MKECKIEGCAKAAVVKAMCRHHYQQAKKRNKFKTWEPTRLGYGAYYRTEKMCHVCGVVKHWRKFHGEMMECIECYRDRLIPKETPVEVDLSPILNYIDSMIERNKNRNQQ